MIGSWRVQIGLVALLGLLAGVAGAQIDSQDYGRDLAYFGARVRTIGSPGYDEAAAYLRQQIAKLPGVELREQEYPVFMPQTDEATLTLDNGKVEKVYPFWPAHIRLNATPVAGISGKLVYVGQADFEQMQPKSLAGQIAVIESRAGGYWQQAAYFGARAILVLGTAPQKSGDVSDATSATNNTELRAHELVVPVEIPRFYVPPGELAEALRKEAITGTVTLKSKVNWRRTTARNLYAYVPSAQRAAVGQLDPTAQWAVGRAVNVAPPGWTGTQTPGVLVVNVPFDAGGLVPDLAYSASQAAQTAAGLALLRDWAKKPLARPAMVCFIGGDSVQFLGSRNQLMALADSPELWREELKDLKEKQDAVDTELARANALAGAPQDLDLNRDLGLIARLVKILETDSMQVQEELFRLRRAAAQRREANRDEERTLEARLILLSRVRYAFERSPSELRPDANDPDQKHQRAVEYMARTIARLQSLRASHAERQKTLEGRIELYHWLAGRLGRTTYPDLRTNDARLIELLLGLDLSDHGVRFGPMYTGRFQDSSTISNIQEFRDWFTKKERTFNEEQEKRKAGGTAAWSKDAAWWARIDAVLDVQPLGGSRAATSWLTASMPIGSEMAQAWGIPGFSLVTLDDLRLVRDTPNDTLDNLSIAPVSRQLDAVATLLRAAWDDPKFKGPQEIRWAKNNFEGQVVSPAPGRPVPDLPRPGFLATYYYITGFTPKVPPIRAVPYTMGIRRSEIRDCDDEGNYRFEALPKLGTGSLQMLAAQVYRLEPDSGQITAASDMGKQAAEIKVYVDLRQDIKPVRSLVFDCETFSMVGLYDPRFLQDLNEMTLLDARRNADPQRFGYLMTTQMLAAFVEPGTRSNLIFRYGRVGNRLILINMPPLEQLKQGAAQNARAEARGYTSAELNGQTVGAAAGAEERGVKPLSLATSRDFLRLDQLDMDKYRAAGVSNQLLDRLQKQSQEELTAAEAAYRTDRGQDVVSNSNAAWANQALVYSAAQAMASDVVRAAIFLLLLCVPFSFCMERLIVGTPNIYKQIGYTFVIFTIMTAALWSFHPAFKISSSPLIIILAFAIIFMSLVVIGVVYGKFDSELKKIRSGRGTAATTSFARASVLMSAILLGIANMRKRKFRTALTSITIFLITFAVLAFTSATQYLETTTLPTGLSSSHAGIMLRQRGWRIMPPVLLKNLHASLDKHYGGSDWLVERWWNVNAWNINDQIHITASGPERSAKPEANAGAEPVASAMTTNQAGAAATQPSAPAARPRLFPAVAILGLNPNEARTTPELTRVIPNFTRLTDPNQKIVFMSHTVAQQLKVGEGDWVKIGGLDLQVAGLFDSHEYDRAVVTLSGEPLSPLKYSGALDASGRNLADMNLESLEMDADTSAAELSAAYEHLSSTQFVIVPTGISRLLPNASLRSVALQMQLSAEQLAALDEATLRKLAEGEGIADSATLNKGQLVAQLMAEKDRRGLKQEGEVYQSLVKRFSDELARRFAVVQFAGFQDGVKMVASGSGLPEVAGASQVAIPLAIAGLIIFNTMMGSIAERRREIHIYTSLGLAPMHVGALFVAEALTYGLIGTVFGYIIGQGVGTLLLHLGWLGNVTLNYSGTSAMLTMGLILLIVLLSALVPARLASKIAAPSIERTWKVPLPKGDEILANLPFTINKTAADGALAYLAEFFDAHQEGSIGKFSAGKIEPFTIPDESGRNSRGLKTVVWLTPFDLGVRQHLMLLIHPGQYADIYEVQVVLQRLSGDDGSWYRMNRSFLTELRKQFLQWRSLSPQRMLQYIEDSKRLFVSGDGAPALVTTAGGEGVKLG